MRADFCCGGCVVRDEQVLPDRPRAGLELFEREVIAQLGRSREVTVLDHFEQPLVGHQHTPNVVAQLLDRDVCLVGRQ
jgi:hypothetical protein